VLKGRSMPSYKSRSSTVSETWELTVHGTQLTQNDAVRHSAQRTKK